MPADEFLRHFLCHVLPSGFQWIRHYGLLASRTKHDDLLRCRQLLGTPAPPPPVKKTTAEWLRLLLGIDVDCCPRCGKKGLQRTILMPLRRSRPGMVRDAPAPPEDDSS